MTVTSTYDHRVIQGAESGEFLRTLDGLIQGEDRFYEQIFASLGSPSPSASRLWRRRRPRNGPWLDAGPGAPSRSTTSPRRWRW